MNLNGKALAAGVMVALAVGLAGGIQGGLFTQPVLQHKIKILKKWDHELYGGLGESSGAIGCSSDLFIEEHSSLSFRCGTTGKFQEWVYVFAKGDRLHVCPTENFDTWNCLRCYECEIPSRREQLKGLDGK